MILLWDKTDQSPVANAQQAEHYIQRKTMQAFIHARRQIEDSIGHQYGWKSAQWFVVYMLLNLWLYKAGGDGALYTDAHDEPQAYAVRANPAHPVPLHLRNALTAVHKNEGYGTHYRYAHDEPQAYAAGQTYLPEAMTVAGIHFYQPNRRGFEIKLLINWNNCARWTRRQP